MDTPVVQPPAPPPIQPVPPPPKNNSGVLIGIFLVLLGILAGVALSKTTILSGLRIPYFSATPTSTSIPSPTPTANLSRAEPKDWKTYTNTKYKYSIQYPSSWITQNVAAGAGTVEALPNSEMMEIFEKNQPSDYKFEGIIIQALSAPTLPQETIIINNMTMYIFNSPEGPVYYAKVPNQSVYLEITGAGGNTADATKNQTIKQILSTFKFVSGSAATPSSAPSNAQKLTYQVPTGWTKISDPTYRFEAAYDPTNTKLLEAGVEGLNLTKKQLNDNGVGYKSFISIRLLAYDGGSRRQFIYKYMNNNQAPQKQDLGPDYNEKEYLYNNKSCLFLRGIYSSQMPTIWGMCDAGGGNAFLVISYDPDYETTVQTIRLLN